jgi:hypothetical protein
MNKDSFKLCLGKETCLQTSTIKAVSPIHMKIEYDSFAIISVCVVRWSGVPEQCTTHTPNQELHMLPHLQRLYNNDTLLNCILSF